MDTNAMNWTLPEAFTPYLYSMSDGRSAGDKASLFMVIGMFATKTVSLEKAAELAGKSVWDFVEILKKYNIPWGSYSQESQMLDEVTLAKLAEGLYAED